MNTMIDLDRNRKYVKRTQELSISRQVRSYAIKLRLTISALFMCLILPSFGVVVYYIYKNNFKIYKKNFSLT